MYDGFALPTPEEVDRFFQEQFPQILMSFGLSEAEMGGLGSVLA